MVNRSKFGIHYSLSYILNGMNENKSVSMDKHNTSTKLFCLKLELWQNYLEFNPTLSEENDKDSFMQMIKSLMEDICAVSYHIDRIVQPTTNSTLATKTYKSKFVSCVGLIVSK